MAQEQIVAGKPRGVGDAAVDSLFSGIVASTLLIAALALPLRNRIQAVIDRRFYRKKYDVEKVLEAFAARLQAQREVDEATLVADLRTVIQETLQPTSVKVWLVDGNAANRGSNPQS